MRTLFIAAVVLASSLFVGNAHAQQSPEELARFIKANKPGVDKAFDEAFSDIRKTLPIAFNQGGIAGWFDNIERGGSNLYYVYVLHEPSNVASPTLIAAVRPIFVQIVCGDWKMKGAVLGGYTVIARYFNPDRKTLVAELTVTSC